MTRTAAALALVLALANNAFGQDEPPLVEPCKEGVFLVDGPPLLPAPTAIAQDAVILHDGTKLKLSRGYHERIGALLKQAL